MRKSSLALWVLAAVAMLSGRSIAAEAPGWVVSYTEGAVEVRRGATEPATADTGTDVAGEDRITLGSGAKLSVVAVAGDGQGRVVTVRGPAEGTLAELVAKSSDSAVAPIDAAGSVRTASTDGIGGPPLTRGDATGPLRPVYPQGAVAVPCADFVFVPDVDDLGGGAFELRLFDADPAKGGKPLATCKADGPQVDVLDAFGDLAAGKKLWWQVAVRGSDGAEAMSGEPVAFTLTKPPAGTSLPPKGFESPEQRASWHLLRAKSFVKGQMYLDSYREYLALVAAGGGSPAIEKELRNLEKKIGLDEAGAHLIADAVGSPDNGSDELQLVDGQKLAGRVVSSDKEAVLFQITGTRYRFPASDVKEIRRGTGTTLPSAAPFVTVTSAHYTVSTNAGKEYGKEAARNLEGLFAAFTKMFGEALGAHNAKNLKAKIYRDDADFAAFLAKEHPEQAKGQGFYSTGDCTLYLYRSFVDGKDRTLPTLFHEGTHQLLFTRCNEVPANVSNAHYWLSESLPCYMEGLEWKGGSLVLDRPPQARIDDFLRLKAEGKLLPLPEFFALTQSGYRSAERYDQGIAVFWHMMRRNEGRDAKPFLSFVKDYLSGRQMGDSKAFKKPLEEVADGYADWCATAFGASTPK